MASNMDFLALVQTFGVPVGMLLVALVTVINYFINGKVVPRWTFDLVVKQRDAIIDAQIQEITELRHIVYRTLDAAERGTQVLEKRLKDAV